MTKTIITIDGTSGAGKGTLAKKLAQKLQFNLLDSGALYRIVGLSAYQAGIFDDATIADKSKADLVDLDTKLGQFSLSLPIDFVIEDNDVVILLDGKRFDEDIRTETVGTYASFVAAMPAVRKALLGVQHQTAVRASIVADGRDMGTVVFPNADAKIFLTANNHARAKRRVEQLKQAGKYADFKQILAQIEQRDLQDKNRKTAPSKPACDAYVIDSSDLDIEAVFQRAWDFVASKNIG